MTRFSFNGHHKSVEERSEFGFHGQLPPSGSPHNPTTSLVNYGLSLIASALSSVIAMSVGKDGDRSTLTGVPLESHKLCLTSSIPVR